MVLEVCIYDEQASKITNIEDSQSSIDFFFFILAMILQQKRIDRLDADGIKNEKETTLLDFMQFKKLI
jgi:hypothetical protein